MNDKRIIQQAIEQVGQEIGKLQGKLFVAEATSESLRTRIQRLDAVFQNLQAQLSTQPQPTKPALTLEEVIEAVGNQLPSLDPASQPVCFEVADLLMNSLRATPEACAANQKTAIARLESHAWKQGEAIALAQRVVQCLQR